MADAPDSAVSLLPDEDVLSAASVASARMGGARSTRVVRLEPGTVVEGTRYRIERWLGEGGIGVVFECRHVDLERRVALKVLKAAVSPQTANLFREEAIAAAKTNLQGGPVTDLQIGSPYIVEVFDFGELPDGRLWLAMELLPGKSLSAHLRDDRTPISMEPGRAVGILRQICKGLLTAHRAGFIHRDVKPANVMLVRAAGRDDAVKLVDFGVAAVPSDGTEVKSMMVGTPPYMAPEQTTGEAFDGRLDIYAVGCLAYRMLVGRVPFQAPTLFELFRMHREASPRSPSEVNPDVPVAFDAVILKCLAKNPEDRYRDMADLEAALCEAQVAAKLHTPRDDLPLPDVDTERRERLRRLMPDPARPASRGRWVWPLVAAGAIVIAGVALWTREPAATAETNSATSQSEAIVARARAAGARALWVYPDPAAPSEPTAYTSVLELETLGVEDAAQAARGLRTEFSETLTRLGDRYWSHPDGKAFALDYYVQARLFDSSAAGTRGTMSPGELALLRTKAASLEFTEADLLATEPLVALAEPDDAERDRKLLAVMTDETQRAETTEARLSGLLGGRGKAKMKRARPLPTEKSEPARPEDTAHRGPTVGDKADAKDLVKRGNQALRRADRATAERYFNQALAKNRGNSSALYGLGSIRFDQGAYGKAVKYLSRAVAASPSSAAYRIKLGDAYFKNFQYKDAEKHYAKAKALGNSQAAARLEKVRAKLRD